VKVLWQSFLDPEDHRLYLDALRAQLARATPDVEYDVVGIRPPDRHLHALTEVRCGIAALRNALFADGAGYDALVVGHFQEPFLHEIRASVALPVVGLCEASLQAAPGRIGLVTIDEVFVDWHEEQVRRLGLGDRVVGVRALGVSPDGFMDAMAPGPARDRLHAAVEDAAAPLVAAGAEVVVPAGALPAVALPDATVCGVPFLNCVAAAARAVAAARPAEGFAPPPAAALEEFLAATGGPLAEPIR
jgi:Asp/Glu/hydantoin racemase